MANYDEAYFKRNGTEEAGGLYVVKLQNHQELFFKIGISTARSKEELSRKRLSFIREVGYQVNIENYYCSTLFESYKAEQAMINLLEGFAYIPQIDFTGYTECFVQHPFELFRINSAEIVEGAKKKIIFWLEKFMETISFLLHPNGDWRFCPLNVTNAKHVLNDVQEANVFFVNILSQEPLVASKEVQNFFKNQVQKYVKKAEIFLRAKLREKREKIKELKEETYKSEMAIKNGGYKLEIAGYSMNVDLDEKGKLEKEENIRLFKKFSEILKQQVNNGETRLLEMRGELLASLT